MDDNNNSVCPTSFPNPNALGASFNRTMFREIGRIIGVELRSLWLQGATEASTWSGRPHAGLDCWAPNININRDPRWGRNQEVASEDPYYNGIFGTEYTLGLQTSKDDERYLQVVVTLKHWDAYSLEDVPSKNITRHNFNAIVSNFTLADTYWPAFKASVMDGKAAGVMCSYNALNGVPTCANPLLNHVLRNEWGFDGLKRLEGIFSFALWDPSIQRLILIRDRLGIKPIFYAESKMGLAFGSEIKSLLKAGGVDTSINDQAFSEYLWYGNSYEDRSFYNGVHSLLPGQCLIVEGNKRRLEYWWKIEEWLESPISYSNRAEATDLLRDAIDSSVKRQLISDVPVGIFLSGGVDSSAIAASVKKSGAKDVNSYSASFDFDKGIDESKKALLVSQHLGLKHNPLKIKGSNIIDVMTLLAKAHDEPFADAANIPLYLMCKELDPAVKVVLQGDGGDELFAGYRRYQILNNAKYFKFLPGHLSSLLRLGGKNGHRASRMYDAITQSDPAMRMALLLTVETLKDNPNKLLNQNKILQAIF